MANLIELEKQKDLGELGGTFLENLKTEEIQKRVNPYELKFDERGQPNFKYETKTEMGQAEYAGMRSMWELASDGYQYVFWLSPLGGRSIYTEGRLVVGKVIKNGEETEMECRGIPLLESAEKMLGMANGILDRGGTVTDGIRKPEDLREQAIGINLNGDLWQFCEEIFGMNRVWEAIRLGEDVKRKAEVVGMVKRAMGEVEVRFGAKIGQRESIMAGAMLEGIMARWGYAIVGGNHGGTNTAMMTGAFNNIFNEGKLTKITATGEKLSYCDRCSCWYKGDKCPYCSGDKN
jgi:hypothetical protein